MNVRVPALEGQKKALVDRFARSVTYLRVSVTDRCDLRCVYCMSKDMTFLPKEGVLKLEEIDRICSAFIGRGVRKLRLTGGEPLVRRGVMTLIEGLSRHLKSGALRELTLTTNGTQLATFAADLAAAGIKRVNVSLDTLDADLFRKITRGGNLNRVLDGIRAAQEAGLKVKINVVALRGLNEHELEDMLLWAHSWEMGLTFIEAMPLGETGEDRSEQYLPLSHVRSRLEKHFSLSEAYESTGGPARYATVTETGGRVGFITPLTHNFCESCNRVRVSCDGTLFMCLGQEDSVDLRAAVRASQTDEALHEAIDRGMRIKPRGHDFVMVRDGQLPKIARFMSTTGG